MFFSKLTDARDRLVVQTRRPNGVGTRYGSRQYGPQVEAQGAQAVSEVIRPRTERGGFEPPKPVSQFNGLANRRYRPLSHLS